MHILPENYSANNVNFKSVIPVRFYKRNTFNKVVLCDDKEIIKSAKKSVIKILSGPPENIQKKSLIKSLALKDPDYDYRMASQGIFTRKINGIFRKRPAREFLKFISDEIEIGRAHV